MYARDTELARRVGVEGYYVRIAPAQQNGSPLRGAITVRNRAKPEQMPAAQMVSPDALALVRFGLRSADDPRIVNTVRVIDALLKVDLPAGPAWHRYNDDGYGEHADGAPFDGTGIGRAWPLFSGERAHYELAAGRAEEARRLLLAMEGFANETGLIPEQVWDSPDIPVRGLYRGRPSGSAMPLVWAHAEYVKLRRSLFDKRVFDMPVGVARRYLTDGVRSPLVFWKFQHKIRTLPAGKALRIETLAPATLHWSADDWRTRQDVPLRSSGLGTYTVDLPVERLALGARVRFTFQWEEGRWEGRDFEVEVVAPANHPVGGKAAGR
jgi:glucoamylase